MLGGPLVFFGLLEGGLRLTGYGTRTEFFVPDDDQPGFYCTNPNFTELFLPAHFGIRPLNFRLKKRKEPGSVRVFVLGESAAQGTPEPAFGFAAQLQAQLSAHYAGRKIEVFNLGITAINSHVVYQVTRQLPDFEPDLLVVYLGNNEVIGPYGPGSAYLATMPPLWAIRASVWARGMRTGQLLLRLLPRFGGSGAKNLEWRGMETFAKGTVRGNDPRLVAVYGSFERNLRDILETAAAAGAKTVLSTVVANLKDSSPFVSLHRADLGAADLAAWQAAFDDGLLAWNLGEGDRARAQLGAALRLDGEYADTHFMLGRIAESCGEIASARQHFLDALHWDALRFRPDPKLNDIIRRVAREAGPAVQLVDAARAMGSDPASTEPLCGGEFLFEHVHFNWDGNARLTALLAEACVPFIRQAPARASWLTSAECATVLGYTEYGRLTMLDTITELTGKPPFTNQLTFGEYQVRLQNEIARARALVMTPQGLAGAEAQVTGALQANPQDPGLMVRLENIEFDLRHFDHALELVDQAMTRQPRSAVLVTQKANLLLLCNRPNEAEELLLNSTRTDPYYFPAWQVLLGVWGKTQQIEKGKRTLEALLLKMPANNYIRTAYASLLMRSNQSGPAEEQWRLILAADPSNALALEQLLRLYQQGGRTAEADALMLESAKFQPRNSANNVRLAQGYAAKGDSANMAVYLRALAESGPVDASLLLELSQRLTDLGREREALVYARRGKTAADAEGNTLLQRAAADLLQRLDHL
jgi:tetratricopeptide (TPR) repeat protein